jgi:hypothetical protein
MLPLTKHEAGDVVSNQFSGKVSADQGLRMNEDVQNFGSEGVGESG